MGMAQGVPRVGLGNQKIARRLTRVEPGAVEGWSGETWGWLKGLPVFA